MAITTYAQLKTAVTSWMDITSSDLSSKIDDLVTIAENRIFREVACKDNEITLSDSIVNGSITLPTDFIKAKILYLAVDPIQVLEPRGAEWMLKNFPFQTNTARPRYYARISQDLVFAPYADSGYQVYGSYYGRTGTLSTAVYDLFTNNPDLYLFACLAESEILIGRDARIQVWEAKYNKILNDINMLARSESALGGNLQMRIG